MTTGEGTGVCRVKEDMVATQMPAIGGRRWRGSNRSGTGLGARLWGKGLPSGRAVIGGLLVAVAMLTVTVASRRDTAPAHRVLVAARDVPAGTVLTLDDLAATEIDVPDAQLDLLVNDPAQLTGRPLVRALRGGELIAASDSMDPTMAPQRSAVTIRLEPERALAGTVRAGEQIAVVATFGDCSEVIAPVATVVDVTGPSSELGGQGVMVTLELASDAETVGVVNASDAGHLTLIRSTGTSPSRCAPESNSG